MTTTTSITPIRPDEILDLGDYERRRESIRSSAMAARNARRVMLGANATISFENRETIKYQIQEMCRTERLAQPTEIEHEIETYSELLPTSNELSATMFFEFPDKDERDRRLVELLGFQKHLFLECGKTTRIPATFDKRQIDVERLSSVQFIRFALTDEQRRIVGGGGPVRIVSDHPRYLHTVELGAEIIRALAADLDEALAMESARNV